MRVVAVPGWMADGTVFQAVIIALFVLCVESLAGGS